MKQPVFGIVYGNRDFFPDRFVQEARAEVPAILEQAGIEVVQLSESDTKLGGVETYADARKCADLFKSRRDAIEGVIVVLPNFGDEKGILETIRGAGLDVPVLVQGYPDRLDRLGVGKRRDSYCGKVSVCNNFRQAGIAHSLTSRHVVSPGDESFGRDLDRFVRVCRIVRGLRGARLGAIGARPGAFNTVRYSEKLLERSGITVTTADLSEMIAGAARLGEKDPAVSAKIEEMAVYIDTSSVPPERLRSMASLAVVLDRFVEDNDLDATAVQCWTSVQQNQGCNVCTAMSMMSERLIPSACEVDITGALSMYVLQLAAGTPAALADWNNNYGDDPDRCVLFHCGNWPASLCENPAVATAPILGTTVGEENTYGAIDAPMRPGPFTFARCTTDDASGAIRAYTGEGVITADPLDTFGNRAVAHIPGLERLMRHICTNGFEHHVAVAGSAQAAALREALGTYMKWDVYRHEERYGDE
jgi:L-fucose isomerase-like protein